MAAASRCESGWNIKERAPLLSNRSCGTAGCEDRIQRLKLWAIRLGEIGGIAADSFRNRRSRLGRGHSSQLGLSWVEMEEWIIGAFGQDLHARGAPREESLRDCL